jgi:acyl transferase domain-containing protein
MGEGAGILILKRLEDALRDNDRIYAVIKGVGSSSDGRGKGITAPNPEGQRKAIRRALASSRISSFFSSCSAFSAWPKDRYSYR